MDIIRIFLVFVILFITFYILYRLYIKRLDIQKQVTVNEGFSFTTTPAGELSSMNTFFKGIPTNITNVNTKYTGLPLREFCIKGSFNSAMSGNYVNVGMLETVIGRGCRFVDLNVVSLNGKTSVISTAENNNSTQDSANSILFQDAIDKITSKAFTNACPNSEDPFFIYLRVLPPDISGGTKITDFYDDIKNTVINIKNRHADAVTGSTILANLLKKTVIILDKTTVPDYLNTSLKTIYNMIGGGDTMVKNTYLEIAGRCVVLPNILDAEKKDGISTNISGLQFIYPDNYDNNNPNLNYFVKNYGVQFAPNRFYIHDANFTVYEEFFNKERSAFIPLAVALRNISTIEKSVNPYVPDVYTGMNDPLTSIYKSATSKKSSGSVDMQTGLYYGLGAGTILVGMLLYAAKFS